jgi:hypothetical protein
MIFLKSLKENSDQKKEVMLNFPGIIKKSGQENPGVVFNK